MQDLEQMLSVNLKSVFYLTQLCVPKLISEKGITIYSFIDLGSLNNF